MFYRYTLCKCFLLCSLPPLASDEELNMAVRNVRRAEDDVIEAETLQQLEAQRQQLQPQLLLQHVHLGRQLL